MRDPISQLAERIERIIDERDNSKAELDRLRRLIVRWLSHLDIDNPKTKQLHREMAQEARKWLGPA